MEQQLGLCDLCKVLSLVIITYENYHYIFSLYSHVFLLSCANNKIPAWKMAVQNPLTRQILKRTWAPHAWSCWKRYWVSFPFLIGYGQVWPDIPKMAVKWADNVLLKSFVICVCFLNLKWRESFYSALLSWANPLSTTLAIN